MNPSLGTILVTGGAGFIGAQLTDKLIREGYSVVVIDSVSTRKDTLIHPKALHYKCRIGSPAALDIIKKHSITSVFLLAYNVNVPFSVEDPLFDLESLRENLIIVSHCLHLNIKKIVFASTGFVYGNTQVFPTPEGVQEEPNNPYGLSKLAMEGYLRFYARNYGFDVTILRFGTVYGPTQRQGALRDYIQCLLRNESALIYGDGTKTRDYVFVDDVANACFAALRYDAKNLSAPVFNIATGRETSLNDVYRSLQKILGRENVPPLYAPDRPGEIYRFCLDITKAKKELGWAPTVSFEDGLQRMVRGMRTS